MRVRPDSTPERGDIVAFRVPEAGVVACGGSPGSGEFVFVNRVIGLPGEEWAEKKGYIYINGELLSEPYLEESRRDVETIPSHKIPAASYLILGDNRSASCDSRRWGPVPRKNVIGGVYLILRGDEEIEVG